MRARPWLLLAVAACLAVAALGDGHDDDGSALSDDGHGDSSHDDGHGDGHDSSSHDHGGEHANHAAPLILLVVALFFGVLAKTLLAKSKIPYTVLLLLAGVAVGWGVDYEGADDKKPLHRSVRAWDRVNPHLLMYLFLPVLIFESAFSVDVHTLFRELFQVLTLAVPGVALSTALTACVARWLFAGREFTWAASLMLGAILSATDPVAVVALLKELGVAKRVGTLIEGESLFNDGTAIVVFNVFFHELRDRGNGGGIDGGEVAVYFLRLAGGGVLLGVLVGGATVLGLSYIYDDGLSEITLTIVAAMGTFLIAEMITVDGQALTSGVLAVVALGLIVGSKGASRVSATVGLRRRVVVPRAPGRGAVPARAGRAAAARGEPAAPLRLRRVDVAARVAGEAAALRARGGRGGRRRRDARRGADRRAPRAPRGDARAALRLRRRPADPGLRVPQRRDEGAHGEDARAEGRAPRGRGEGLFAGGRGARGSRRRRRPGDRSRGRRPRRVGPQLLRRLRPPRRKGGRRARARARRLAAGRRAGRRRRVRRRPLHRRGHGGARCLTFRYASS